MLGKLIKNEFIQRGKAVVLVLSAIIISSILIALIWMVKDTGAIESEFFDFFTAVSTFLFGLGIMAGGVGLLVMTIGDFGKRLFKDQGYLTHTLPVKVSSILVARMVFDIVLIIAMGLVFPLSICIAVRDFSFFSEMFDMLQEFMGTLLNSGIHAPIMIADFILVFVLVLLSGLMSVWMFNCAYAIGHSFGNNKRVMSVIAYVALATISQAVSFVCGLIAEKLGWLEATVDGVESAMHMEVSILIMLIFMLVVSVVGMIAFAFITGFVCKKKLNLE